jgi:riboflavin biosynthesis pyrimidine reductase
MQTRLATLFELQGLPSRPLPAALREGYGGDLGFGRRTVYANFVTSLDGVAALDPQTPPSVISGKSDADRLVMGLLRAFADAIVVGAGTLRAEPHHLWTPAHIYPDLSEAYAETRSSLGLDAEPRLVVLTGTGNVDPNLPAFQRGALIVTTDETASRLSGSLPGPSRAVAVQDGPATMSKVLDMLRSEGHRVILTEGGPTVLGKFLKERLLDELFLTLAPRLAGRMPGDERLGLLERFSFDVDKLQPATLLSAKQDRSHLFLRYRMDR